VSVQFSSVQLRCSVCAFQRQVVHTQRLRYQAVQFCTHNGINDGKVAAQYEMQAQSYLKNHDKQRDCDADWWGVYTSDSERQLLFPHPLLFFCCQKIVKKSFSYWKIVIQKCKKLELKAFILRQFRDKIKILGTHNLLCRKFTILLHLNTKYLHAIGQNRATWRWRIRNVAHAGNRDTSMLPVWATLSGQRWSRHSFLTKLFLLIFFWF